MFRRRKADSSAAAVPSETQDGGGSTAVNLGKGRPTPTRREAEAAAKARAKAATAAKGSRGGVKGRAGRAMADSRTIREGIRAGDERYLRPRDQGPVRRFVRDFVDVRLSMAELAVPGFFLSFLASAIGYSTIGTAFLNALLLVIVLDSVLLKFRLGRELKRRFPNQELKGTTLYAFTRVLQMRFLRLPKPQVRMGQPLPEHYR